MATYTYVNTGGSTVTIKDTSNADYHYHGWKCYVDITNNSTASAEANCPHFATVRDAQRYVDESTFTGTATYLIPT